MVCCESGGDDDSGLENRFKGGYDHRVSIPIPLEKLPMSSVGIATVVKMMESLPEPAQARVVDHLREYIEDLRDEEQWDTKFQQTQPQLAAAAQRARQEIQAGQAQPLDPDEL